MKAKWRWTWTRVAASAHKHISLFNKSYCSSVANRYGLWLVAGKDGRKRTDQLLNKPKPAHHVCRSSVSASWSFVWRWIIYHGLDLWAQERQCFSFLAIDNLTCMLWVVFPAYSWKFSRLSKQNNGWWGKNKGGWNILKIHGIWLISLFDAI
jgi:hypothetical protein